MSNNNNKNNNNKNAREKIKKLKTDQKEVLLTTKRKINTSKEIWNKGMN